jgi:hypothetical protein
MSLLKITQVVKSSANAIIFDLFHAGKVEVGGRVVRLSSCALPAPIMQGDYIVWVFPQRVKVATPGPDSSVSEIRQYRDRIEFRVGMWADVRIEFE